MKLFLSYAAEDRDIADEVKLALVGAGHEVFFDRDTLPPGGDYYARIEKAVSSSDAMVFLISPSSVADGSFALSELKLARSRWPHPKGRVVPVRLHQTPWAAIPPYLKSVTVLEPEGSVAAEVVSAVKGLTGSRMLLAWTVAIMLVAILGAALLLRSRSAWTNSESGEHAETPGTNIGLKGPDTSTSPSVNTECPEVTFTDYSKFPPESRIERRCEPQ